ncbi:sialate O-acetylesterase [Opitutaceae bacterium TAV4]|nr:sialate O-acetylesterase [Opitutaceae bacterium TAV4]RRJ99590.1 sialate O-acetylesterase [Opitutaceae bacterium TAV3]
MKIPRMLLAFLCGLALAATSAHAAVKAPAIFGDNMVLQRELPVPVWGTARPGEKVTVTFAGQTKTTTATADGTWRLKLDPLTASATPAELTIQGENQLKFSNVLVGEVWLCSGQSNMEWQLQRSDNATQEIANASHPTIRLFQVKKIWNDAPQQNLDAVWTPCTPDTAKTFSGVGYFFGRELNTTLDVPVGLINSSWGGTRIEPWTSPSGFDAIPALADISKRIQSATPGTPLNQQLTTKTLADYTKWLADARKAADAGKLIPQAPDFPPALQPLSKGGQPHQQPTTLYNAMISPFVPYALRGAIWYQGESNRGEGMLYYEKMKALIKSWRTEFDNPQMPLHFAQLAPYTYGNNPTALADIWQAQERFAKEDKLSGMAVINDIGNLSDIHPTNKQVVGKRLALHALNKTYGQTSVKCESPTPGDIKFEGGAAIIPFDHAQSLTTRDGQAPDWFELAGPDGVFKKATAEISGTTVTVRAPGITAPKIVRFAWLETAEPNLRNEAGLQAGAFTFGEIPVRAQLDKLMPEAATFKIAYALDPLARQGAEVNYLVNDTARLSGKLRRVAYFLHTVNARGEASYAFVSMDPFTTDLKKIGVPTKNSGARFQQSVQNLDVKSNVPGVKTGAFKQGNIEYWDCNYGPQNASRIPGASETAYDFGDRFDTAKSPGYGSMQIHNTAEKQTILAYNKWESGKNCDLGIGNQPAGQPDWTFSSSGKTLQAAQLLVLVEME